MVVPNYIPHTVLGNRGLWAGSINTDLPMTKDMKKNSKLTSNIKKSVFAAFMEIRKQNTNPVWLKHTPVLIKI